MDEDYDSLLRLRIQDLKDERDNCLHLNHIEKMGIIHRMRTGFMSWNGKKRN
mgnify:CR=1 FL=1